MDITKIHSMGYDPMKFEYEMYVYLFNQIEQTSILEEHKKKYDTYGEGVWSYILPKSLIGNISGIIREVTTLDNYTYVPVPDYIRTKISSTHDYREKCIVAIAHECTTSKELSRPKWCIIGS